MMEELKHQAYCATLKVMVTKALKTVIVEQHSHCYRYQITKTVIT
jgi:hypothetical protein